METLTPDKYAAILVRARIYLLHNIESFSAETRSMITSCTSINNLLKETFVEKKKIIYL